LKKSLAKVHWGAGAGALTFDKLLLRRGSDGSRMVAVIKNEMKKNPQVGKFQLLNRF